MTALDPLARVREMRASEAMETSRGCMDCLGSTVADKALDALEAVLAIPQRKHPHVGSYDQTYGYNQARDDFRSAISTAWEGRG